MATILTKKSDTSSAVPASGDLTNSTGGAELAVNTADKRIFTKNSGGTVVELGTNPSTLTVTGNTTLGDASTDTVTVNGYMGVGGAGVSQIGLNVQNTLTGSVNQYGIESQPIFGSGATTSGQAFDAYPQTSAASFTMSDMSGYRVRSGAKGAGSTITNLHGVKIDDLTIGTNNYGITSAVSSGSNKWNIYASGTAQNYFAGRSLFGATSAAASTSRLSIKQSANNGIKGITVEKSDDDSYLSIDYYSSPDSFDISATYSSTGSYKPITFRTSNVERLRIDSSGNVGIGTSSPATQLQIGSASGTGKALRLEATGTTEHSVEFASDAVVYGKIGGGKSGSGIGDLRFYTYSGGSLPERMRIDSSGNVGVGTSSPSQKLSVLGVIGASGSSGSNAANPSATHTSSSSVRVGLRGNLATSDNAALDGVGTYLFNNAFFKNATGYPGYIESAPACYIGLVDNVIRFHRVGSGTANADITSFPESMRIDSSGNLLVGQSSSNFDSTTLLGNGVGISGNFSNTNGLVVRSTNTTSTQYLVQFVRGTSACGSITSTTTNSTTYATSSDYRLKENIAPMSGALEKVSQLKPCIYTWKTDGSAGQGFIAHELQAVVPECVVGEKDAVTTYTDEEGVEQTRPVYQGVDTSFLVATLTAAIQEQQAIIESLKSRLDAAGL